MMIYVGRYVVPGRFLRAVRAVFAYVVGRQSVTVVEIMRLVQPITGSVSGSVFFCVWRSLISAGGCASYEEFLGLCLREGRYI